MQYRSLKPNFVSAQTSTCDLAHHFEGEHEWSYVRQGTRFVSAGRPGGSEPGEALEAFKAWCEGCGGQAFVFGCELSDVELFGDWNLTEIGCQALFCAGPQYLPSLSGSEQPKKQRELRRQARRAIGKGLIVEEITNGELWKLNDAGRLRPLLHQRWRKRALADFSFLVELRLSQGPEERRCFVVRHPEGQDIEALVLLVPCDRGWLLEHQILSRKAPNGTGELLLCHLLNHALDPGVWLSLGVVPMYGELSGAPHSHSTLLSGLHPTLIKVLLSLWEPLYGFRSLFRYRKKLEPDSWEPVYWAVPKRQQFSDTLTVLRAFAGGSLFKFAMRTVKKWIHQFTLSKLVPYFSSLNFFYVFTLLLWIPVLWSLDGEQLFGYPFACRVWAIYDLFLLLGFCFHQRVISNNRPHMLCDILLGLVSADIIFAWAQTALHHGGFPKEQPLGSFVFLINTAPVSALIFLSLVRVSKRALPF